MRALAVIASLGCSACFSQPPAPAAASDAARDGAPAGDAPVTCRNPGTWQAPVSVGFTSTDHEYGPWLSPDGLDLYYSTATQAGTIKGVTHVHRSAVGGSWSAQSTVVLGSNTVGNVLDANVWLSDDQLHVYWTKMQSYNNICFATRTVATDPFPDGTVIVEDDADMMDVYDASLTSDENTIVYEQTPHGGNTDTVYIATRASTLDKFAAMAVSGINRANNISSPMLMEDKLTMFWADTDPASGMSRIFTSTRASTSTVMFPTPTLVDNQPTSNLVDIIDPFISRDGTTLVFAMDTGVGNGFDLYQMTRTCN